ncbi:hypothetical protein TNIN_354901 [Trichonephila inaurata madagascariensis]|uniref:Uncharacterized protein n=1 Tax=Trichonephila inaurata madagascariensis TaxID=2747483 RepID=A0A8X6IJ39_9ARAC|nr:hypothetical protein TNIN_354901 [Trichonephila inaurata madagascariensis]
MTSARVNRCTCQQALKDPLSISVERLQHEQAADVYRVLPYQSATLSVYVFMIPVTKTAIYASFCNDVRLDLRAQQHSTESCYPTNRGFLSALTVTVYETSVEE